MKKKGFIILNEYNNFGWDDNTEFYEDFNLAGERAIELTSVAISPVTFKVVPATLTY